MLFHSVSFLFVFLPLTWLGFLVLVKAGLHKPVLGWLTGASLVFYAWWNPAYLWLIVASIAWNFSVSRLAGPGNQRSRAVRFRWLCAGLAVNLLGLAYFKYANFFVDNLNAVFHLKFTFTRVILPLAVSFFTFQQIVFLVESYRGRIRRCPLLDYSFAVTFFPHLIAGPIVQYQELLPQIRRERWKPVRLLNLQVGVSIFILGLFKKMVLGDGCGEYATPIFHGLTGGNVYSFVDAWVGTIAYTFQIYFDFSGYSDMAIGLARCFGIILPLNFNSPYLAASIIDFWRRWHMTLSRFLRDYLYIPLGGGRGGSFLRFRNLMITMLLGGLWHGAGWNFVIWGGLHGAYLTVNHAFRACTKGWRPVLESNPLAARGFGFFGWGLTLFAVTIAWVFFRAETTPAALSMLKSMFMVNPAPVSNLEPSEFKFLLGYTKFYWILLVAAICFLAPSTQTYLRHFSPSFADDPARHARHILPAWKPSIVHGLFLGLLVFFVLRKYFLMAPTEFLYFNF